MAQPLVRRGFITLLGVTLLITGLALAILPGPGLLVILAGLAVLASEYPWVDRHYQKLKTHLRQAKDRAKARLDRHNQDDNQ